MPGSRPAEISGCGAIFFEALERLIKRTGPVTVLVPAINEEAEKNLLQLAHGYPNVQSSLIVKVGESHKMIEAADAVLVASGTAALECALYKKPMVVGYKMPGLTGLLMEKKGLINCVSLPNILLKEKWCQSSSSSSANPIPFLGLCRMRLKTISAAQSCGTL